MGKCNPVGIRRDVSSRLRITHAGDEIGKSRAGGELLRRRQGGFRGPLEHVLPTGIRRRVLLRLYSMRLPKGEGFHYNRTASMTPIQ